MRDEEEVPENTQELLRRFVGTLAEDSTCQNCGRERRDHQPDPPKRPLCRAGK